MGQAMRIVLFRVPSADPRREAGDAGRETGLAEALRGAGHEVITVASADPRALRALLSRHRPDMAWSSSGRFPSEGAWIPELLDEAGMPFVGSPGRVLERCLDKAALKEAWREAGIATPPWRVVRAGEGWTGLGGGESGSVSGLPGREPGFPLIAKPLAGGNSVGISEKAIFMYQGDIASRLPELLVEQGDLLLEVYLGLARDRREFTVALVGQPSGGLVLPLEIFLPPGHRFPLVSELDKEAHRTIPRPLPEGGFREELVAFARRAFEVAGVRDYARMDLILAEGQLWAIEVNGQPMLPDRWFQACAADAGLGESYLTAILEAAIVRNRQEAHP
jgi:D-alanine-D-alanine ligase